MACTLYKFMCFKQKIKTVCWNFIQETNFAVFLILFLLHDTCAINE